MRVRPALRRSAAVFAFVAAALMLPHGGGAQTLTPLRVADTANDGYAEGYYAQDKGFFKQAGLDVDLMTFANGAAVASAVAGGAADIGISNPLQLANAIAHNAPFVLIAPGGMYSSKAPTTLLCVAKNSPLRTAKDLEGKTIAVSALKDITQASVTMWLAQNGADPAKVRFVEIPFAEMGAALGRGTVDAATLVEPMLTVAKQDGLIRPFAPIFDVVGSQFLIGTWFTTPAFARSHPDVIRRFQNAIATAGRWANANHEQSAEVLAKYSKAKVETLLAMTRMSYALTLTPQIVQPQLDAAFKSHILDRQINAADIILRP